ncbi:hypothetical protein [Dehalogenimonas alkenigignens]|uniref:Uncharacterized protein n=1 Tax=Dehalogenimonas alkenigignens TaxID=1217799 RepID=A0A0W0GL00_9CHLR|nr:hypothetical protein [Dehalogenimonas alkenigignens]KTB49241.1 hypothetical protein DEALK_01530 [Dehalogenimonas alkenigignens]PVV83746.1 hypothetical protein DD509_05825 [Dehalogenimonas alkenigignens]
MRENIFGRLTQSIAYVTVGSLFIITSGDTFGVAASILGILFIVIGFMVALSGALQLVPRWIIRIETIFSVLLYLAAAGALIKVSVTDGGIEGNTLLVVVLFIYIIMLPAIQTVRILKS